MKRKVLYISLLCLTLIAGIFIGKAVFADELPAPGSQGDPLVTKSYVDVLENKITALQNQVATLENTVKTLQDRIAQLEKSPPSSQNPNPPAVQKKVIVIVDKANIRSGPGTNYSKIGEAKKGATYILVSQSGSWYKIKLAENKYGYIYAPLVKVE